MVIWLRRNCVLRSWYENHGNPAVFVICLPSSYSSTEVSSLWACSRHLSLGMETFIRKPLEVFLGSLVCLGKQWNTLRSGKICFLAFIFILFCFLWSAYCVYWLCVMFLLYYCFKLLMKGWDTFSSRKVCQVCLLHRGWHFLGVWCDCQAGFMSLTVLSNWMVMKFSYLRSTKLVFF